MADGRTAMFLRIIFLLALPGVLSSPPAVTKPATSRPSVVTETSWKREYSFESAVISFADLGDPALETRGKYHGVPKTTTDSTHEDVQSTEMSPEDTGKGDELTSWSITWYLTLLSAFIFFFVFIGLMEIFCRRRGRFSYCCGPDQRSRSRVNPGLDSASTASVVNGVNGPPPPYDLFKPPSYNTLFPLNATTLTEKKPEVIVESPPEDELVYVISVHSGRGVS